MCNAHPTRPLLAAYASGFATTGESLAVAAHLTYCAECRSEIAALEALAGALLSAATPVAGPEGARAAAEIAAAVGEKPAAPSAAPAEALLPAPVRAHLADTEIRWKFRMPGIHECVLDSDEGEEISLLKVRPAAKVPQHTHEGVELTVVLSGELIDGDRVYRRGDIAIAGDEVDHRPEAGGDEDCICLAVVSGRLKFTGRLGRALNLFT